MIMTVVSIASGMTLERMCVWVSATIIVFYIIGQVIRLFLIKKVFKNIDDSFLQMSDDDQNDGAETSEVSDLTNEI